MEADGEGRVKSDGALDLGSCDWNVGVNAQELLAIALEKATTAKIL
jgi:hypothetical protein